MSLVTHSYSAIVSPSVCFSVVWQATLSSSEICYSPSQQNVSLYSKALEILLRNAYILSRFRKLWEPEERLVCTDASWNSAGSSLHFQPTKEILFSPPLFSWNKGLIPSPSLCRTLCFNDAIQYRQINELHAI